MMTIEENDMKSTIDMAREAFGEDFQFMPNEPYQRFAELVRADERSALLDLVDDYAKNNTDLKAAIRSRGETK